MPEKIEITDELAPPVGIDAAEIRRVAGGDREAFARIYDAFSPRLYPLALRMLKRPEDAEELLQEVFAKIWKDAADYDSRRGAPLAWAIIMTRNKAIDRIRAATRRHRLNEEAGVEAESHPPVSGTRSPGVAAERAEEARAVRGSVAELPTDIRETIELAYFGGLSQSQISQELSLPLTTVKSRIRSAMNRLRESLGRFA